jgi:hypothetical protein
LPGGSLWFWRLCLTTLIYPFSFRY